MTHAPIQRRMSLTRWFQGLFLDGFGLRRLATMLGLSLVLAACGGGGGGPEPAPPPSGAPAITAQPTNVPDTAGQPASFTVVATVTGPLTYELRRDGNAIRAFDPAASATPVTIATAGSDFLQLGEVGVTSPVAIYRNEGAVIGYRLDGTSAPMTLQTLADGESVTRGGGGAQQLLLVISNGTSSRVVQVNSANVLSVPLAGGTPLTLAQSSPLRVANQGPRNDETLWCDLIGAGGVVAGSSVVSLNSNGSGNQPLNPDPEQPLSSATLFVLDHIARAVRVTYGALAVARYNGLDVTGVAGPGRPVLVSASSFQTGGGSATDLYFVRVGSPGLVRLTSFVP